MKIFFTLDNSGFNVNVIEILKAESDKSHYGSCPTFLKEQDTLLFPPLHRPTPHSSVIGLCILMYTVPYYKEE
jgi:hypothetical protein